MTDDDLIQVDMTVEAAQSLWKALVWATARAEDERMGHYDWLAWAQSRVGYQLAVRNRVP